MQVEYAHEQLEDLHPLEKTPVREAFEWLGAVTCYKKAQVNDENFTQSPSGAAKAKTVIINGKEITKRASKKKKKPIGDDVVKENPIAQLGFGIVAYVNILWTLIWTFTLYTILLIPTMMSFGEGTAYDSVPAAVKSSYLPNYLGNMGYSSVQCASIPTDVQRLAMSCPYGTFGEFLDYGVNPLVANKNTCVTNDTNRMCKPDAPFVLKNLNGAIGGEPTSLLNFEGLSLYVDATGKEACDSAESTLYV